MSGKHNKSALRRGFARHGVVPVQKLGSAIWGLFFKGLAVVVGASIAVVGVTTWTLSSQLAANGIQLTDANGNPIDAPTAEDLNGAINVLLVGSDTRAGQGKGYGTETSVLADVIILLHISADRNNAVAMSFPRDLLVPWPACPSTTGGPGYLPQALGQINATIANGGPGCTLLTVEKLTGLKIPYLAMIDFKGVIEMSNAIGGVKVCVAKDIDDEYTRLHLKAGDHTLMGYQALQFLRTRHGVGDGSDLSRISNQQVFLTSLIRKVKSDGVLTNPMKLYSLANAAARNMTLSSSLTDLNTMVAIAGALKDIDLAKITFLQVPSHGGLPAPYSGRVKPTEELSEPLFAKLRNDEPILIDGAQNTHGSTVPTPTATPKALGPAIESVDLKAASPSATPTPTYIDSGVSGTNGATETCSG